MSSHQTPDIGESASYRSSVTIFFDADNDVVLRRKGCTRPEFQEQSTVIYSKLTGSKVGDPPIFVGWITPPWGSGGGGGGFTLRFAFWPVV